MNSPYFNLPVYGETLPTFTPDQQDIYNQILMLCGPTYYCEPPYKTVAEISNYTGSKRALGICMAAVSILEKFNAEPARRQHLQSQIKLYQYNLQVNDLLSTNGDWGDYKWKSHPDAVIPLKQMQQVSIPGALGGLPKKLNKINRYLIAFISEASNSNVVSHQSVSEYQVSLICTVCNATFSYDEDAESDWAVNSARDFCHEHRHVKIQVELEIPSNPAVRRKFRDE
jgi:hypothetical protein